MTEFRPKVILGGNDGTGNWLQDLPKGAIFACKRTKERDSQGIPNFSLLTCQILNKTPKTVILVENLLEKMIGRVEPIRFCSEYTYVETLWQPEEGKSWPEDYQQEERNHEQRDRNAPDDQTQDPSVGDDSSSP